MPRRCFVILLSLLANPLNAAPGFVTLTVDPPRPTAVSEIFQVTIRLFDYTDQAEVDRFRFEVHWPGQLFAWVPGSIELGAAEGADQQWLSKPNQETRFDGYQLSSLSDGTQPGLLRIDIGDSATGQNEGGTLAESGFLVAFRLQGRAPGTGLIRATAHAGATGPETFYGTAGTVLGVPQFSSVSRTVLPDTRLAIRHRPGEVIVSWSTGAVNYQLQTRTDLSPNSGWTPVNLSPDASDGFYSITLPARSPSGFWRLFAQ